MRIRHAICNEIFEGWDFRDSCRYIRSAGYEGIEIAHFTLADDPSDISAADRKRYRGIMEDSGLKFVGLHWLMVAPKGLHVTTPDESLRAKGWGHIRELIRLCADLGPDGVMVFGSPKQRATTGGSTRVEATRRFVDGLAAVAPEAEQHGVTILVEALPLDQTDVVLSLEEAVAIVKEIGSPAVRTMFDTHNAVDEKEPHAVLLDRYYEWIRHIHVNETDGGHCGTGDYDFRPILEVLLRRGYPGWVSLEAFQFEPGAETIATESIRHLNNILRTIPPA
jgi:D-psicose/D-tagatose/L-ribulose 3-epimerase